MNVNEIIGPGWEAKDNFAIKPFYTYIADNFLKDGMNIVEIGIFMGQSSIYLASKIKEKNLKINFLPLIIL